MRGAIIMKKKCIFITLVTFAILFLLTFLLPKEITVNAGIGKKQKLASTLFFYYRPFQHYVIGHMIERKEENKNV